MDDAVKIFRQYMVRNRAKITNDVEDNENNEELTALYPSELKKYLQINEISSESTSNRVQLSRSYTVTSKRTLRIIPEIITFVKFIPGNIYHGTITIINTGKVSHFIRIHYKDYPAFILDLKGALKNVKLPPGLSCACRIEFRPTKKQDYIHKLCVISENEGFEVPIIAIGPRAILDFPDFISMPKTPVKQSSSKTLPIQIIGDTKVVYKLFSDSPQFTIEPSCGIIKGGDVEHFVVKFTSSTVGIFTGIIYLKYETGELLQIDVQGRALSCDVKLKIHKLHMNDTFLGFFTAKILSIFNNSDFSLKYQWMLHENDRKDEEKRKKFSEILDIMKHVETQRYVDLQYFNTDHVKVHNSICERIYSDEVASLEAENFYFTSSQFTITPMEDTIWPRSHAEIIINFHPSTLGKISTTAYLNVSGKENRIPLEITGICQGPIIKLNTSTIDVGQILLNAEHNTEIICTNEGLSVGTLMYKSELLDFGGSIVLTPQEQEIEPGQKASFNLSFSSTKIGEFIENLKFIITESSNIITLFIKGIVISSDLDQISPERRFYDLDNRNSEENPPNTPERV